MKYIDILQNLGVEISEEKRFNILKGKIFDIFLYINKKEMYNDEHFCQMFFSNIGIVHSGTYIKDLAYYIFNEKNYIIYLSYLNLFLNMLCDENKKYAEKVLERFKEIFDECKIMYFIDNNNFLILPNNSPELNTIIMTGLNMLKKYPDVREYGIKCINKCDILSEDNINDFLDNLRKLLEIFMQRFFNSDATLENNNKKLKKFLEENGVSTIFATFNYTIINLYNQYNNDNVKHHIKGDIKAAEYLMYETFNIIYFVLSIKND